MAHLAASIEQSCQQRQLTPSDGISIYGRSVSYLRTAVRIGGAREDAGQSGEDAIPMSNGANVYVHGHHESVLRSHRWRTAANSAAYLLPHLTPGASVLDVGAGPGTI